MIATLQVWWFRALQFVDQFKDEAPACCGTCRGCVGATTAGALALVVSSVRRGELPGRRREPLA
jgi:hypothetical protein